MIVHSAAGDDVSDQRAATVTARYERFVQVNSPHDPKDLTSYVDLLDHREKLMKVAELIAELESEGASRKATNHLGLPPVELTPCL